MILFFFNFYFYWYKRFFILLFAYYYYKDWDYIFIIFYYIFYYLFIHYFLFIFLLILFLGPCFLLFIPSYNIKLIKLYSLYLSGFFFSFSLLLFLNFWYASFFKSLYFFPVTLSSLKNYIELDFIFRVSHYDLFFFDLDYLWLEFFPFYFSIGLDGLSLFFVLLTTFLIFICVLISWNSINYRAKEFFFLLFIIEFLLINVFCSLNLFFFYIFFEAVLIPMFLLIGIWGSRQRKFHAVYMFFFYTLIGSLIMLLGLLFIYSNLGSLDFRVLLTSDFSLLRQKFLWLTFFIAFAIKIPMIPFHIWLPEAHVEAPTAGSVILAGLLLKLGSYGILRFIIFLFSDASFFFTPLVYTLSLIGIIYGSCTTVRQIDLKKIIAYSSVAHMNFVTLGLFSSTIESLAGSVYLMLSHGLVSSGLFISIGYLYDRYKTRLIFYYGGLVWSMPFFSLFFFILILANISFPGTSSFVGEFLVLIGLLDSNFFVTFIATFGIVLGAIYSFWLYNRVCFQVSFLKKYSDISLREFFILFLLISLIIIFGIFPNIILFFLELPLYNYYSLKILNNSNILI